MNGMEYIKSELSNHVSITEVSHSEIRILGLDISIYEYNNSYRLEDALNSNNLLTEDVHDIINYVVDTILYRGQLL